MEEHMKRLYDLQMEYNEMLNHEIDYKLIYGFRLWKRENKSIIGRILEWMGY